MSLIDTATTRRTDDAQQRLREGIRPTARRGRVLASLRVALLCLSGLIAGLFIIAIKDVLFVLPGSARLALLLLLVLGAIGLFAVLAIRLWRNPQFNRAAGQQIDVAANARQQPVTIGLSLSDPIDDDTLACMLLQRAEQRAMDVARSIKPAQAYPTQLLKGPMTWLAMAAGLWLLLALILPSQVGAMFSRVAMPWGDAPPFSLTQLQPQWTPKEPMAGDDVTLTVEPTGRMPEAVDWIVLDEAGDEAERFPMQSDGQGGFTHQLKRVDEPIDFRLEAFGRHTRTYTITPTPRPPATEDATEEQPNEEATDPEGTAQFDAAKAAQRDLEAHRDWPGIKANLEKLLSDLAKAQAEAERLDPADAEALQALADKLALLNQQAEAIAEQVATMQGDLPSDAAALLDSLSDALGSMQTAALPAPTSAEGPSSTGQPTPAQWLEQAAEAAKLDQQQIGQGIGPSELPSNSGTASGQPGETTDPRDPDAKGTYSEINISGDNGPLPEAVMRQIPPSYREHVSKYFERLAEEETKP